MSTKSLTKQQLVEKLDAATAECAELRRLLAKWSADYGVLDERAQRLRQIVDTLRNRDQQRERPAETKSFAARSHARRMFAINYCREHNCASVPREVMKKHGLL